MLMIRWILWFTALSMITPIARAEIRFQDVTQEAGTAHAGHTYGASWGDFNSDGWPDLWVSNHLRPPSLYVNNRNGTFSNVADNVVTVRPHSDLHGAAWADFDNDGDQDLIVMGGGGQGSDNPDLIAKWKSVMANYLFVNENGALQDNASDLGVEYFLGRGRTPLWFDANQDRLLDLVLMNAWRSDGQAPSAVFLQTTSGFTSANRKLGFRPRRSLTEKVVAKLRSFLPPALKGGKGLKIRASGFAQLADLSGDGESDLVVYSWPMRVYSLRNIPFEDIANDLSFPYVSFVKDVAIADFDGDLQFDMYLARARWVSSGVAREGERTLVGCLWSHQRERAPNGIHFQTPGAVTFRIRPSNPEDIPQVFIGSEGRHSPIKTDYIKRESPGFAFTLSPYDLRIKGPASTAAVNNALLVDYESVSRVWTLRNYAQPIYFNISSSESINEIRLPGPDKPGRKLSDKLLVHDVNAFAVKSANEGASPTACHSVAAGDYDNDMDLDLYLVCSGLAANLPNILLENDGKGNFVAVAGAGGAAGSSLGLGDSVASADYDRDGFLDLFITNGWGHAFNFSAERGPHQLFRNSGNQNHWVEIDLEGSVSNRDGIGARVVVKAGGVVQVRSQSGGIHNKSQNHQRIHFGLAENTKVSHLIVQWPSGLVQELKGVTADQILRIKEPER